MLLFDPSSRTHDLSTIFLLSTTISFSSVAKHTQAMVKRLRRPLQRPTFLGMRPSGVTGVFGGEGLTLGFTALLGLGATLGLIDLFGLGDLAGLADLLGWGCLLLLGLGATLGLLDLPGLGDLAGLADLLGLGCLLGLGDFPGFGSLLGRADLFGLGALLGRDDLLGLADLLGFGALLGRADLLGFRLGALLGFALLEGFGFEDLEGLGLLFSLLWSFLLSFPGFGWASTARSPFLFVHFLAFFAPSSFLSPGWLRKVVLSVILLTSDHSQHGSPSSSPFVKPSPSESFSHKASVQRYPAALKSRPNGLRGAPGTHC